MILKFYEPISNELIEYLRELKGINDVVFSKEDFYSYIDIEFDKNIINSFMILEEIKLFEKYNFSILFSFDKKEKENVKKIRYTIDDICCEYCHSIFIENIFKDDNIVSLKTDADFSNSVFEVNFDIEYINYTEEEVKEYLDKYCSYE